MILQALVITFVSLGVLSLSQTKHRKQVMPAYKKASPWLTQGLQLAGFSGLCFAATILIVVKGWSLGLVYWFGGLTVTAFALALLLSFRPKLKS